MLPSLKVGLFGDDLVQRLAQLRPAELPPRAAETGFVPPNSGELKTVVSHLFSYLGRPESIARAVGPAQDDGYVLGRWFGLQQPTELNTGNAGHPEIGNHRRRRIGQRQPGPVRWVLGNRNDIALHPQSAGQGRRGRRGEVPGGCVGRAGGE